MKTSLVNKLAFFVGLSVARVLFLLLSFSSSSFVFFSFLLFVGRGAALDPAPALCVVCRRLSLAHLLVWDEGFGLLLAGLTGGGVFPR